MLKHASTLIVVSCCVILLSGCTHQYRSTIPDYQYTVYDTAGTPLYEIPFQNGHIDGAYKEYYRNGKIKSILTYSNGQIQRGTEHYFDRDGWSTILYQKSDSILGHDTLKYIMDGDTIYSEYAHQERNEKQEIRYADGSKLLSVTTKGTVIEEMYTDVQGNRFIIEKDSGTIEPVFFADTENGITETYIDSLYKRFGDSRDYNTVDSIIDSYGSQWKRRYIHYVKLYSSGPGGSVPLLHKRYKLEGAHILIRYVINADGSVNIALPIIDESENPLFVAQLISLSDSWNFGAVAGGEYSFDRWYRFKRLDSGKYGYFY
ncbi:MAG: hypothetical protein OCD01_05025 [Fibrobacterales bacterium]